MDNNQIFDYYPYYIGYLVIGYDVDDNMYMQFKSLVKRLPESGIPLPLWNPSKITDIKFLKASRAH